MKKAYTLVECVIVISIITILITISLPSISYIDKKALQTETDHLMSVLSYLRQSALTSNKQEYLIFDADNQSYIYGKSKRILPNNIYFGCLPGTLGPPSNPKNLVKNPITYKDNKIIFYPNGIISPGTVYLRTSKYMKAISSPISQISYIRQY